MLEAIYNPDGCTITCQGPRQSPESGEETAVEADMLYGRHCWKLDGIQRPSGIISKILSYLWKTAASQLGTSQPLKDWSNQLTYICKSHDEADVGKNHGGAVW